MNKFLTPILLVVAIFAGSAGANFLKGGSNDAAVEKGHSADSHASSDKKGHGAKDDGHGAKDSGHGSKDKKAAKSKGGHGKESDSYGDSGTTYYKFSREFVVPIMRDDKVTSLVILNLSLEVDSSASSKMFGMDPKLRDNIMTTLVELSNDGVTLDRVSDVHNYETVRSMVLKNLKKSISEGITNVLILDMAKQDL